MASELESNLREPKDWDRKWLVVFNLRKTQLVLPNCLNDCGAINVKMSGSILDEKLLFMILGFSFSVKFDYRLYFVSTKKILSQKVGTFIYYMKFLPSEVASYLYKFTIVYWLGYCCIFWAVTPTCFWEILFKLEFIVHKAEQ